MYCFGNYATSYKQAAIEVLMRNNVECYEFIDKYDGRTYID